MCCTSTSRELAAPAWAVQGLCLPAGNVDALREVFRQSLKRYFCLPTVRLPWHNSLYSICFGSRLSRILTMCLAHLACAFCWTVKTLGMSARSRTSVLGIWSCHVMRSLRRQLGWKCLCFPVFFFLDKHFTYTSIISIGMKKMNSFGFSCTQSQR